MAGKFIVFEGIDGCGKGTQIHLLSKFLFDLSKKNDVIITREYNLNSEYGRKLHELVKTETNPLKDPELFSNLFYEDRKYHVEHLINPILKYGGIILSDRYTLSSLAYQWAQGINLDYLMNKYKGFPTPDLTLLFDVPPETALSRVEKSTRGYKTKFEKIEFLRKVRSNYLELAKKLPEHKVRVVDASKSVEEVHKQIIGILKKEKLFEELI
ncbi:MAG: dTMP kinase [Candidatus Nanoarchaeia archaeon]|nr:dTMP kinase [Candidatus Nanoarchaeia archaeon]